MEIKNGNGEIIFKSNHETIRKTVEDAVLSWANLSGADLSGANLSGANLSGANLSGANLSRANLSWANLSKIKLCDANFHKATITYREKTVEIIFKEVVKKKRK